MCVMGGSTLLFFASNAIGQAEWLSLGPNSPAILKNASTMNKTTTPRFAERSMMRVLHYEGAWNTYPPTTDKVQLTRA
jgi:hypothetical protein